MSQVRDEAKIEKEEEEESIEPSPVQSRPVEGKPERPRRSSSTSTVLDGAWHCSVNGMDEIQTVFWKLGWLRYRSSHIPHPTPAACCRVHVGKQVQNVNMQAGEGGKQAVDPESLWRSQGNSKLARRE
jgi:hypothetical protein